MHLRHASPLLRRCGPAALLGAALLGSAARGTDLPPPIAGPAALPDPPQTAPLPTDDRRRARLICSHGRHCGKGLGDSGAPQPLWRFRNGQWGFVQGNGIDGRAGGVGLFVVLLRPGDAARTVYYLDTGSAGPGKGLSQASAADLDGDHVVDYVYAGDTQGHVWRFDLSSRHPRDWAVSRFGRDRATPLFSTPPGQPISSRPVVAIVPAQMGPPRVIVAFGTGHRNTQTASPGTGYAGGPQSLYGIWDWDMDAWNGQAPPNARMSSLNGPIDLSPRKLQAQTVSQLDSRPGERTVSGHKICWQGSNDCSAGNTRHGWLLNLPTPTEQITASPRLYQGALIVNTVIPAEHGPQHCTGTRDGGWTLAVSPASGGVLTPSFFPDRRGQVDTAGGGVPSGLQLAAIGDPVVVPAGPEDDDPAPYLLSQRCSGPRDLRRISPPGSTRGVRLTWQQIR